MRVGLHVIGIDRAQSRQPHVADDAVVEAGGLGISQ